MKDPLVILELIGMILCTVAANLFLKIGAAALPEQRILFGILGPASLAGFVFFGLSGLIYALLLRSLPLNVAQSLASAQFLAVILASRWILSEPIPPQRWLGMMLIIAGILVVGLTPRSGVMGEPNGALEPADDRGPR